MKEVKLSDANFISFFSHEACNEEDLFYPTGEDNVLELGERPRAVYPLVIVLTIPADEIQWDNTDIVSLMHSYLHMLQLYSTDKI